MMSTRSGARTAIRSSDDKPLCRRLAAIGIMLLCALSAQHIDAQEGLEEVSQELYELKIAETNAAEALNQLAKQTGVVLLFPYDKAKKRSANRVVGRYSLVDALDMLFEGTGLRSGLTEKGTIRISIDREHEYNEEGKDGMKAGKSVFRGGLASLLVSIFGASDVAMAQDTQAQSDIHRDDEIASAIEEVIVTARRREESAQSVPVSMTTLSSEILIEKGFKDMRDLTALSPGLRVVPNGGGSNADITLRGMRRYGFGEALPAAVAYFAEVPMPTDGVLFSTMDLENIQVLKGPQGTLFGRNTLAGAILITPKKPTTKLEGNLKVGAGNYDYQLYEGTLNVPIIEDKVALRVAGQLEKRDGYVENIGTGGDWNDQDHHAYRVSLLIEPNEWFSNLTIYDYYEQDEGGPSAVPVVNLNSGVGALVTSILSPICGTVLPDTTLCNYNDAFAAQQARGLYKVKLDVPPIAEQEIWGFTNKTEVMLGGVTLRNIIGYREAESFTSLDTDGLTLTLPVLSVRSERHIKQVTEELQLLGTAFDEKLEWMVGGFYLKSEPNGVYASRADVIALSNWANKFYERKNEAVFGQIGYNLTNKLRFNLGYRITWEEASACSSSDSPPITSRTTTDYSDCKNGPDGIILEKDRDKTDTWTIGFDYQVTDQLFLYAVSRRGTREGSFNLPDFSGTFFEPFQTFDQEKVTDVEVGVKADWIIGDIIGRTNLSLYTMDREDIQTAVNMANVVSAFNNDPTQFGEPPGSTVPLPDTSALVINGGETRVDGMDLEVMLMPSERLTLSILAAYSNTKVKKQVPSPFPGFADTPNLVSPSPQWSTTVGLRYQMPIDLLDTNLTMNANYFWTDEVLYGNDFIAPSYEVTDFRMQLNNVLRSNFDFSLFVENVFDNEYFASSAAAAASLGFFSVNAGAPRMWGIEINYVFGDK